MPAELELTGSTTVADGMLSGLLQVAVAGDLQSSTVLERSFSYRSPLQQLTGVASVPPTSATSKKSPRTVASSFQAAQRMDDLDLDNKIESVTQSILSPWDVESAMRMPLNASAG
jgi:hypothetical protein